jgi:hypothetical protein
LTTLISARWPALGRYCPHAPSEPQLAFLLLDHREVFYGGAAGGGKSDALLMAALQYVDEPGYHALIVRRTFAQLSKGDTLILRSQHWLARTDAVWNEQRKRWTFPSGATLEFGHVEHETSMFDYDGAAFQFIGFDEATSFTERQYEYIGFSRARRSTGLAEAGVPIRTRATGTPGGEGHSWVKRRFIDKREPGVVFIPAKVADNPGLDVADYAASLGHLPDELRRQLLDGDWGAFEGAAFTIGDEHLVDGFELRDAHERFEACDYGLNGAPWALCPVDFEGNVVFADMLYEKDLLPSDLCELVLANRKAGWGFGHQAFADPSIWHRTGTRNRWGAPAMLADEFTDHGVQLTPANNDPRAGLIRLRELLEPDPAHPFPSWHPRAGQLGAPRVFFHRARCERLVDELRSARLQPLDKPDGGEKIDPEWESRHGHAVAMCRYAVMTRPAPSVEPRDERAEMLAPPADPNELRREALAKREAALDQPHRKRRYSHV